MSTAPCSHLSSVQILEGPDEVDGCETCLAEGGHWVHLRMCMTCGRIGCCDSSPNKHASKHALAADHPIFRSAEPGEDWAWCAVDDVFLRVTA
jgi:uncharacterized UBP type Zn finger protein